MTAVLPETQAKGICIWETQGSIPQVATAQTHGFKQVLARTDHNVPAAVYTSGLPEPDYARFSTALSHVVSGPSQQMASSMSWATRSGNL